MSSYHFQLARKRAGRSGARRKEEMTRIGGYLAMKTDVITDSRLMESDGVKVLGVVSRKVAGQALMISGLGFGTTVLKWVASFAAM